jgi:Flp pilus assembly protein TadB
MTRRLSWGVPETPPPKHPYRDTILVYAGLALVLVLVAWLTGGGVGRAAAVAVLFFVVATGWTSYRFHAKLREQRVADDDR